MKFLCLYKSGGEEFRLRGFANSLVASGHDFTFWSPEKKPAFDAFSEYKPDVFIGTTFDLPEDLMRAIENFTDVKVILKGSNYGHLDDAIKKAGYPVVIITDQEKQNVSRLGSRLSYVFCHYHPNRLDGTMEKWIDLGVRPVALMNAADVVDYGFGTPKEEFKSDLVFIGGHWGYKSQNLNRYILPLCEPVGKYKIKIWGNQPWPVGQYLGLTDTKNVKHIYASAKVSPNVSEPHSNIWGFDAVERPFKIISSGGCCITDHVSSLQEDVFTNDELPYAENPKDFLDLVKSYILDESEVFRADAKKRCQTVVYNGHTYFHRAHDLLSELGRDDEAKQVISTYEAKWKPQL